ncbi:hypothetical protein V6N13_029883 [Hibiscus sabdariffa]
MNPKLPSNVPGGSSSGSAVAVAAELVDFALGTDTIGCIRVPAALCGILGFRPSHGAVSRIGLIPNSQSLDTIGWFARDPSVLSRVGHVLLKVKAVEPRRARRLVFADDLFQLSKVPKQKTLYVVSKALEKLSGSINTKYKNVKVLYKVRTEMWAALQSLLKDDGILVIPTIADPQLKLNSKKEYSTEFHDTACAVLSVASMSGGCQVSVPLGKDAGYPVSVSFVSYHGADKFLLDTVLDIYASLQNQVRFASNSAPLPDVNGTLDASELLKEKVCPPLISSIVLLV